MSGFFPDDTDFVTHDNINLPPLLLKNADIVE
jgi:hypothetical protein